MAREINLVPDIKNEMIRSIKLRNLTFFACIVVAIASVGVSIFFAVIAGGQQAVVDSKMNTISNLSKKIDSYKDLSNYLTVRNQLSSLSEISNNKKSLSRIFNILTALIPKGNDNIKISELMINLENDPYTLSIDAQANAGDPPYIDYRVLDAFKKSMQYMRYDYGNYVDKNGTIIPAYCMIEYAADGSNLRDDEKGIYAYWLITGEGCNPSIETDDEDETGKSKNESEAVKGYEDVLETYEGQKVVRIWRTPQFTTWYKENSDEDKPYMTTDGAIYNVPHFESSCISYNGIKNYRNTGNPDETVYIVADNITWVGTNDSCNLISTVERDDGIWIRESSNGRNTDEDLVLRFSAIIYLEPGALSFNNEHMIAISPSSRFNVTDSFVQIQDIFSEPASDCLEDDTSCNNDKENRGGN